MLIESLRPLALSREVEVVFSPSSNDVEMDFVPDYLRKIVLNILSNALKYTPPEGRVLISARVQGSEIVIRFADNGKGIPAGDLEHIFEPFYQGTNSKTAVGTGVGLSLVKLLVEAMNGSVSVKSSLGIGSIFVISLPLSRPGRHDAAAPLDDAPLPSPENDIPAIPDISDTDTDVTPPGGRPSVLIVEDNVSVANYMASLLADSYNVYTARNGEEGLAKALNIIPDLIVSDIMMPVMDGIQLLSEIRGSDILSHLPVVLVTARASDTDRIEGISAGADAYISKPFNADELRAVAARLVEQRRLLCEKYRAMALSLSSAPDSTDADDRAFISRLISVIYALIGSDRRTDTAEIASRMNTSDRSLARKIQALTGESTVAFVNRIKVDKAKRLLDEDKNTPMAEIALRSGFDDPAYFSRIFKLNEGVSPSAYRRRVK